MAKVTPENATEIISQYMLTDVLPFVLDFEKSQGSHLYDARGKRSFVDCFSFIASNPLGFNHPKFSDPDFEKRLLRAAKLKPSNSDVYTVEMAEFVDTFARLAMPSEFTHLFLVEGGTLAVENALKTAFDWKVRLNQKKGVKGEKGTQIIHFVRAFHGRSGYSLSLTNTMDPRKTKFFPKFKWPRISNAKAQFPLEGKNLQETKKRERQALQEIEQAFHDSPDDIAAIIIEPIQGEGGDNHFRPEFHQALRKVADQNEAMLIYDEVQTGAGFTGKMWAYEHYGIVPDIVCFGKKMQVCGIMVSPRVEQVENHVFQEASRINSTWGGNLVDMVRAQRVLEIIAEDDLVENVRVIGETLLQSLGELAAQYPDILSNVRGKGFMCAVSVATPEARDKIRSKAFELGAIILGCGKQSLRLRPSLIFTKSDVAELMNILQDAVKAAK